MIVADLIEFRTLKRAYNVLSRCSSKIYSRADDALSIINPLGVNIRSKLDDF